jgi:hypothetical protein
MNIWDHQLKLVLYTALIVTYLANVFIHSEQLNYVVGLFVIGCVAVSFRGSKRIYQVLAGLFLTAGLILHHYTRIPWHEIPSHMTSTVLLLALLYVLPFFNSVFKIGRYDRQISKLLKLRMNHFGQLYYRTSLVSYLLSIFLFFAALPIVYEVVQKHVKHLELTIRNQFVSRAILRGFGMAAIWSPIEILVALSVEITQVNYLSLLPWLLLLSALLVSIDWLKGWRFNKYKPEPTDNGQEVRLDTMILIKIGVLFVTLVVFITVAVVFHKLSGISFFTALTLIVIPFSLIWAAMIRRWGVYLRYSFLVWKIRTPGLSNLMLLFISLGFFNSMIGETTFLDVLRQPFMEMANTPWLLFVTIQLLSICLPLIGFHPLVTISFFGILIQPLLTVMNPISIAIVLLTSSLATSSAGTYNTTVTIMSGIVQVNPYRITGWNFLFALLYGGLGTLLAVILL